MCGRYSLASNVESLVSHFDLQITPALQPRYNISPSEICPVITKNKENTKELQSMRWGLVPYWSKGPNNKISLFNARSETIENKPSFKYSYRHRHCLVPADGYYEWITEGSVKIAYRITVKARPSFAFAGLWDIWKGHGKKIYSFTILTTEACSQLKTIHHRMPVIVEPRDYSAWLTNKEYGLFEKSYPVFTTTKVGKKVNNPQNDGPELWSM